MIEFDNIQKSTLQSLRVTDIQIAALETNALLGIKFHLENPPKLSDIRDEFNDLKKAVEHTRKNISRLLGNNESARYREVVLNQIQLQSYEKFGDESLIEKILDQLTILEFLVIQATKKHTKDQTRNNDGSAFPIMLIDIALDTGIKSEIKLSSTPTSLFYQIATICYKAATLKEHNPERAIAAYIRFKKSKI